MDSVFARQPHRTTIVLVRHGQTDWNVEARLQGHIDVPLNARGKQQSEQAGLALKAMLDDPPFDACYTSSLSRARETAEIILRTLNSNPDETLQTVDDLREWFPGDMQGMLVKDIAEKYPLDYEMWMTRKDIDHRPSNGESIRDRSTRVEKALSTIAEKHRGQRVLVVTHSGVLGDIYRIAAGVSLDMAIVVPKRNAEINVVSFDQTSKQWSVDKWGKPSTRNGVKGVLLEYV